MSTAESWDLTVPDDAGELADKLRRLGVVPGQRLHIVPPVDERTIRTIHDAARRLSDELSADIDGHQSWQSVPSRRDIKTLLDAIDVALTSGTSWRIFISYSTHEEDQANDGAPTRRRLSFVGSIPDGPADLSERTDEHLAEGFGRD
jgi:hypothetical protein